MQEVSKTHTKQGCSIAPKALSDTKSKNSLKFIFRKIQQSWHREVQEPVRVQWLTARWIRCQKGLQTNILKSDILQLMLPLKGSDSEYNILEVRIGSLHCCPITSWEAENTARTMYRSKITAQGKEGFIPSELGTRDFIWSAKSAVN